MIISALPPHFLPLCVLCFPTHFVSSLGVVVFNPLSLMCTVSIHSCAAFHCYKVDLPESTLIKKTDSPSPRATNCKSSFVKVKLRARLPCPCWNFVWLKLGQVLRMLSQLLQFICACAPTLQCLEDSVSMQSFSRTQKQAGPILFLFCYGPSSFFFFLCTYLSLVFFNVFFLLFKPFPY